MLTQESDVALPDLAPSARMAERLRRRRKRERTKKILWGTLTPLFLLGVWEILSRSGVLDERFFPAPTTVFVDAVNQFVDPVLRAALLEDMAQSGTRLFLGFFLGSVAGLAVGLLMGLIPWVRYSLSPLINSIYPLPKLALYPLMIMFFGIGNTSMLALVVLGVFFMVSINTVSGVTYSPAIYREVGTAFQVPRIVRLFRITLPAAIPSVIGGLKLGFGQALIIVVSTEFVGGDDGVGYLIWHSWQILNVPLMFVGLAIVGLVGWLGSSAITALAKIAVPWQDD
nr:ABC transporter permease [Microbacterium pseudoresistens]